MRFEYSYFKNTSIVNSSETTNMSFAPDLKRDATYFRGDLNNKIPFREAISALNSVVVADLRTPVKDKTEYKEWAEQQDFLDFEEIAAGQKQLQERMEEKRRELEKLQRLSYKRLAPFYKARGRYFNYLYKHNYSAWLVLDPVITVHPDQLFFECFSQDESSYGCLALNYEVFKNIGEFACGTTNIDYSENLYNEFQKIRSYKNTAFQVEADGFSVKTEHEEDFKEVKIDLPDSWVRGFLQVSSAMTLPAATLELDPMDIHNICFILRRKKELFGPRSMRFILKPGEPVKIIFEPWNQELICGKSIFKGNHEHEIRVWGRRRLHILERLIPVAKKFTVALMGSGMPSFYIADLGDMTFTLGLSGWTANDWSRASNFDLMAPRENLDDTVKAAVFELLKNKFSATPEEIATQLNFERQDVLSALSLYVQAGRVVYDMANNVYRLRELTREPLPVDSLRFENQREEMAGRFVVNKCVNLTKAYKQTEPGKFVIEGKVKDKKHVYESMLILDGDESLLSAACTCNWYQQNKLYKGPCEHMLAVRAVGRRER